MRSRLSWLCVFLSLSLAAACGDDDPADRPDGSQPDDPDAAGDPDGAPPVDPCNLASCVEGGEVRLEWIQSTASPGNTQARMAAFFYASQDPADHPLPPFPGCVDMRDKTMWPLAQGTIDSLDVGSVIISGPTATETILTKSGSEVGPAPGTPPLADPFGRPHGLWYTKTTTLPDNGADTLLPPDSILNVVLTGSSEWPAQVYTSPYIPPSWAPISPGAGDTLTLEAGTAVTLTYTPGTPANLPEGYVVNTFVAFTGTNFTGPIIACQEEGADGSITIAAEFVDIVRAFTPGRFVRQAVSHSVGELSDGSAVALEDRKRIDFFGIYCYNNAWIAAP